MDLSFKEYLQSKLQLRQAIEQTPRTVVEYEVRKYCSIALGENKEEGKIVGLKPKNKLIVEWRYDVINNPTIVYIKFKDVQALDEQEEFQTFWPSTKLKKWLSRHTREGQ
jgi:hypothetical protein